MSDVAVRVRNLGKWYRIGGREPYRALRDTLTDMLRAPFRLARTVFSREARNMRATSETIWALKDVSFDIRQGDTVGIIGRNGAGKSTLLKILSRITEPSAGSAELFGQIGSLLEVGTGFHPELTGRENIYLNGAILGIRKAEIDRKLDSIIEFSGIEKFIDTTVKRYSSGMYVRLAFAVAAHMETDILLVDEVLAVGDAEFQKKCLGKMSDVARQGRTVLFVSHNMASIQRLCNRGIVLSQGGVVVDAPIHDAVSAYLRTAILHRDGERIWSASEAPGNDVVRLRAVRTVRDDGQILAQFDIRDAVSVEVEYDVLRDGQQLSTVLEFLDAMGEPLIVSFDEYVRGSWGQQPPTRPGSYRSRCRVPGDLFHEGDLMVNLRIFSPPLQPNEAPQVRELEVIAFSMIDTMDPGGVRGHYPYDWGAPALRPRLEWKTERVG